MYSKMAVIHLEEEKGKRLKTITTSNDVELSRQLYFENEASSAFMHLEKSILHNTIRKHVSPKTLILGYFV